VCSSDLFELEYAESDPLGEETVDIRFIERNMLHVKVRFCLPYFIDHVLDQRQVPETEYINFKQSRRLHFRHRPLAQSMSIRENDRYDVCQWAFTQQHTRSMCRGMSRQPFDLHAYVPENPVFVVSLHKRVEIVR